MNYRTVWRSKQPNQRQTCSTLSVLIHHTLRCDSVPSLYPVKVRTQCSPSDAFLYSLWAKLFPTFHDTLLKMALISFLLSTSPSHLNHPKGVAGVRGPRDARSPFSPLAPPLLSPFFVAFSKTRCGGHDNITSTLFLIWVTPPPPPLKYSCRFSNLY